MSFDRFCYVFPKTENFREERPRLCYEYMYGWLDGYGILFDPVLQSRCKSVPVFSNGAPETTDDRTFYITCSGAASKEFFPADVPGLFICPPDTADKTRRSLKERFETPQGTYFYPIDLPYQAVKGNDPRYTLGENSVLLCAEDRRTLYFEFFSMTGYWIAEYPYRRLTIAADMLAGMLDIAPPEKENRDLRINCQSYGIARLYLAWLLRLLDKDPQEAADADGFYLQAVQAYIKADHEQTEKFLFQAFETLYKIRTKYAPVDLCLAEFPHAGILFPENGFFELEWPEGSRQVLSAHLHDAEACRYRASFEMGASCWKELAQLYPDMIGRFRKLWEKKSIELTNGTWGLPYSFVSPLALQYGQLACGNAQFEKLFGRSPSIYQCQENAFTPQMPELLAHFGYEKVIHTSQNHGRPPYETAPEILWKSPGGTKLPALTCSEAPQIASGINFFYELPLRIARHKDEKRLAQFSFMDLGFIPLREQMIRIAGYAPVFGRFTTPGELFGEENDLPEKTYRPDDYNFSSDAFYRNYTNANAFSQYEHVFSLTARWRVMQMLAEKTFPAADPVMPLLCSLEAHDCDRVQGQRPGEFYFRRSNETSPYLRDTLMELLAKMRERVTVQLDDIYQKNMSGKTDQLFNPAEVPLTFAEVREVQHYSGNVFSFAGKHYAAGNFAPLALGKAQDSSAAEKVSADTLCAGNWQISSEENKVTVRFGKKKISFTLRDRQNGPFTLSGAEYAVNGRWITCRLNFILQQNRMEAAVMEGITTLDSDHISWQIRYAAPGDFREDARWEDYLALSFEIDETAKISNLVPNMLAETAEKKICSSSCLAWDDPAGGSGALLFSGVGNFRREGDRLDWLFHAASETVFTREISFAFGDAHPLLLSRAVSTGLWPLAKLPESLPQLRDQQISLECRIAPGKWLISNLLEEEKTLDLPAGYKLESMTGEVLSARLAPLQLAVLTVK